MDRERMPLFHAFTGKGLIWLVAVLAAVTFGLVTVTEANSATPPVQPSPAGAPPAKVDTPPNQNDPNKKPPEGTSEKALLALGYSASDVQTALEAEKETGVPALTFLRDQKKGKAWVKIYLAQRHNPPDTNPPVVESPDPAIDEAGISALMAQGYEAYDIMQAASLGRAVGMRVEEVLQLRKPGQEWREVDSMVYAARADKIRREWLLDVLFDHDPATPTPNRSTRAEVEALIKEGFALSDILTAYDMEIEYGVPLSDLLARNKAGETWPDIDAQFPQKSAEIVSANKQSLAGGVQSEPKGYSVEEIGEALGVDPMQVGVLSRSRAEVEAMQSMGLTMADIARAGLIAKATGTPVLEVAAQKTASNTWVDVAVAVRQRTKQEGDR